MEKKCAHTCPTVAASSSSTLQHQLQIPENLNPLDTAGLGTAPQAKMQKKIKPQNGGTLIPGATSDAADGREVRGTGVLGL